MSDNEEWNRKRLERNAWERERRLKAKLENPNYTKEESAKRQERRLKAKEENPEKHKAFLLTEKQKREIQNRQILNDLFDHLYEENKHTFPTPVSKTLWEKLKKEEIDFLHNPAFFSPGDNPVFELLEDRKEQLDYLLEHPDHPCAPSIIFYIKTMVHRYKDNGRKLTDEEIDWIHSVELSVDSCEIKKKPNYDPENKKQKNKEYYEAKKLNQKTVNLNIRFMKADPNRVLTVDDITINPFVSNYCQREAYKINLWKEDKNPEYLEKWKKQREDYEKEVSELSIEYKENFLKNKWQEQS